MDVIFKTTTGNYGSRGGLISPASDPVPPVLDEGWGYSLVGCAAADGVLFWFWKCQKPEVLPMEIVHAIRKTQGEIFASCGIGPPHNWSEGEKWSENPAEVNCPNCLEQKEKGDGV